LGVVVAAALPRLSALELGAGSVDTSNPHAWVRHGWAEVVTVRTAMQAQATRIPTWFNRPPCHDGRFRFILRLADGSFGIWVLEQVGPLAFREVTAFTTRFTAYVKKVSDDCGNDDWRGHSYAQREGTQKRRTA